ncbi:histidine kinase [Pseudomonas sp. Leaf127]|uniref:LuxR C-terminal-related transcriptional regulator n=1 Tax=Pseudomonas sp. Leaf127 TaxID=1736267 RepID=UPI000702855D|nr:LuxR C-terminal-related transcriptional regulator [Pseudomonas sp. Leaf127]KQQ60221.1 histidine kinase [Pseudomonas sp. Leaf127]
MTRPAPLPLSALDSLTEREKQTLGLITAGHNNKQIARELGISDATVKIYVRNLLRKFDLHSRLELASWMHRHEAQQQDHEPITLTERPAAVSVSGLVNDLPALIYKGDNVRAWRMQYVSEGCLHLTGYSAEQLMREHSFGSLILEEYADYVWYCVQCALLKHEPFQLRYRICCADGRIKDVCETGVGLYSNSGEIVGVEGVIFEVGA